MNSPHGLVAAAEHAYLRGEDRDAVAIARRALGSADNDPTTTVRALHVLVLAAQRWWRADGVPQLPIADWVAEAQKVADQSGDPLLKSIAGHARGAYLIATRGLPDALAVFEDAVRCARASGDVTAQVDAISELGHHLAGRDIKRALRLLNEAHALIAASPLDDLGVRVRSGRICGFLGVGHFDDGRFDDGERWLRRSLADLEAAGVLDQFLMMSNYLGQLLAAAGRYGEGRSILNRALDRTPRESEPSMHLGYNLGLLGKLELEAGRPSEAEEPIHEGWRQLRETRHASVRPILRNYLAELLLHPGYAKRDPDAAADLLLETEQECRRSGFLRSELNATALYSRALRELGDIDGALDAAARAAEGLDKAGTLPALRSEEIYLTHYYALRAADRDADAADALARAREILLAKAATIADPRDRHTFLTEVTVSAAIQAASA